MQKIMFKWLPVMLLSGATAFAGSFTSDFSNTNQPGYTLNTVTDPSGNVYPVVTNSALLLLANEGSLGPDSIVLNDLDTNLGGGLAIDAFTANFDLQIGPGTGTPADGIAFVFGPDITSSTAFGEEGPNMPSGGVAICFVTYAGDGPGIGFNVRVFDSGAGIGGIVAGGYVPMQSATMVDSQLHNVSIAVDRNGTLNMVWNGQTIFTNLFLSGWSPVSGQFAIGGRNGGDSQQILISNLDITTIEEPATPVAPIVTSQPQSITVGEHASASFSVGFDGDAPISFQWTETVNDVLQDLPDATNSTLLLTAVSFTNNGAQIACILSSPAGSTNSQAAILTVTPDTTKPTVTGAVADFTFTNVVVTFSKPVNATALTLANYTINNGVTIFSVARVNPTTVALGTSLLGQDTSYILTINGVQDTSATPNTIAPNTQVPFDSFAYLSGTILHKVYYNCSPDSFSLANLFADPRYPNNPDRVDLVTTWEWPPDGAGTFPADTNKSMFYDSMEGYFIPPSTGDYVFFTSADDEWYLFLSTNENPANMELVAEETGGWANYLQWETPESTSGGTAANGSALNWNTATFPSTEWPTGNTISLTSGKPYYMIMFHHDHSYSGGDQFDATVEGPNTTNTPADGDASTLIGNLIAFDFNPTGSSISFNQQPQSVTALVGTSANFSVEATGVSVYGTNVAFQWESAPAASTNWTDIANATTASLATSVLALTDNGTQYRVIATMAPVTATSAVAVLTVLADTNPPVVSAGGINGTNAGTVDIGVGFNKTVDDATGSLQANYSVSSGTITGFVWATNRFTADSENPLVEIRKQGAMLTVTGFSGSGTVTVKNIADTFGNVLTSTNVPVTIATNLTWGVVGANQLGGWNAVVPVGPGDFDVYSDGIAEWGTYDETTFVYEQVTGDFDKKLRVEYQDGSSEWGRCGIIVRDVLNLGVDSSTQTGSGNTAPPYDGTAGRYQKCHVNPVGPCLTGPGTDGNALWEGNRRLDTGGASTTSLTNVDAIPNYPNAWCRIQRQNQTFTIFRSADGTNWELLGQTVWGQDDQTKTPMPATVYVGPEFSPENGNITDAIDQGTFLGQFRDYGDYVAPNQPTLSFVYSVGSLTLNFTGILQSSTNLAGPYVPVPGALSPSYNVNPTAPGAAAAMFYRAAP
jgi:hypothetical protein